MKTDNKIDLITFLRKLYFKKVIILKCLVLFVFLGIVISILSPVSYRSSIIFVPQTGDESNGSFNLNNIAGIAGINLPMENNDSYIHPDLYPNHCR